MHICIEIYCVTMTSNCGVLGTGVSFQFTLHEVYFEAKKETMCKSNLSRKTNYLCFASMFWSTPSPKKRLVQMIG